MLKRVSTAAAIACAAAALALPATPAVADPAAGPATNDIVGVGDAHDQSALTALAGTYNGQATTPADKLASWDATGSTTITPKAGCAPIERPRTSSEGIAALQADASGCVDFARSVRPAAGGEESLAFMPYAYDGVSWLAGSVSNAPAGLSTADLAAIYTCTARTWQKVGGTSTAKIVPLLPPSGSELRDFFLSAIGVTKPGSCVGTGRDGTSFGTLARNVITPASVPAFIRLGRSCPELRKYLRLGGIKTDDGSVVAPVKTDPAGQEVFNTGFPLEYQRPVYAVAKRDNGVLPARLASVFGPQGFTCSAAGQAAVVGQGFGSLSRGDGCGNP
ncbi:hypothetical protein GCM10023196_026070 [Actinoallomurus vinaceus]|uniref:PBP domain-containing protein n=1 Tax=Actinoallomurus vinaceus TaxID=1080074 RepID=A0ABP8U601_9ACTN